jgi:hypothetical protein
MMLLYLSIAAVLCVGSFVRVTSGNLLSALQHLDALSKSQSAPTFDLPGRRISSWGQLKSRSSASPTGYVTLSVYNSEGCAGDAVLSASLPAGICVAPSELVSIPIAADSQVHLYAGGSELMTVTASTLLGVTVYVWTVSSYNDDNCQSLNTSQSITFISDVCVDYGIAITATYTTSLPSVPGFGLILE